MTFTGPVVADLGEARNGQAPAPLSARYETGGRWIFDTPENVPAAWGSGGEVLWAEGESLIICGPAGVGKTTIAQQLLLGRIGLRSEVLGFPVRPGARRVLYLAADRPPQAARSLRRMVRPEDRELLDERLVVHRGPLAVDLAANPNLLAELAAEAGADTIVLDSLKDLAARLSEDATGSAVNLAIQTVLAAGVEVLALHHQRKRQQGGGKPTTLADVYGSTWLTAGAGSVVLIWGEPGDAVVELTHLKQPAEPVGPLRVQHDHHAGRSFVVDQVDLAAIVATSNGLTVMGAARAMNPDVESPGANEQAVARRRLESLVRAGLVHREDPRRGGDGGTVPARYWPIERRREGQ